jgi:hypothetical protein
MMSHLCNRCVREFLILARTWFAFGLPSKTGCDRDRAGPKIIGTLSKSVGFPKLEADISGYRRQHIVGSLFYSNFKVKFCYLNFFYFCDEARFFMSAYLYRVCC